MASGAKRSRSSASSRDTRRAARGFVVCLSNDGYAASLEVRKIYVTLRDAEMESLGLLRVVDESGEAYAYPKERFEPIELPRALAKAILRVR
jgi:hypothetical protein